MPNSCLMHDLNIIILNLSFVDNKVFITAVDFLLVFFLREICMAEHVALSICENARIRLLHTWVFFSLRRIMDALNLFFHYVSINTMSFSA